MKRFSGKRVIVITSMLLAGPLFALPNTSNPTSFLGPYVKLGFTKNIDMASAFSLGGEIGTNNLKIGGNLGWLLTEDQRLKLSAEYLAQNITYSFFSANTAQWVQQSAIDAQYQVNFGEYTYLYRPQFDIDGYASYSPGKNLRTDSGTFINKQGVLSTFTDNKRIVNSKAAGIAPGLNIYPWDGALAGVNVNYDYVRYNNAFSSPQITQGFGGTVHLTQAIDDSVELGISAAIRQPFNDYNARFTWLNLPFYGTWTVGVNGDYMIGKNELPSSYNIGLSFDYILDQTRCTSTTQREEALNFLNWVAQPAVHIPQVLAIADEQVTS